MSIRRHTMDGNLVPGTAERAVLLKYRADIIRSIAHLGLTNLSTASPSSRTGYRSIAVASAYQGRSTRLQKRLTRCSEILQTRRLSIPSCAANHSSDAAIISLLKSVQLGLILPSIDSRR